MVGSCGARYVRILLTAYANTRTECSLRIVALGNRVFVARIAGSRVCVVTELGSVHACVYYGGAHLVVTSVYRVLSVVL